MKRALCTILAILILASPVAFAATDLRATSQYYNEVFNIARVNDANREINVYEQRGWGYMVAYGYIKLMLVSIQDPTIADADANMKAIYDKMTDALSSNQNIRNLPFGDFIEEILTDLEEQKSDIPDITWGDHIGAFFSFWWDTKGEKKIDEKEKLEALIEYYTRARDDAIDAMESVADTLKRVNASDFTADEFVEVVYNVNDRVASEGFPWCPYPAVPTSGEWKYGEIVNGKLTLNAKGYLIYAYSSVVNLASCIFTTLTAGGENIANAGWLWDNKKFKKDDQWVQSMISAIDFISRWLTLEEEITRLDAFKFPDALYKAYPGANFAGIFYWKTYSQETEEGEVYYHSWDDIFATDTGIWDNLDDAVMVVKSIISNWSDLALSLNIESKIGLALNEALKDDTAYKELYDLGYFIVDQRETTANTGDPYYLTNFMITGMALSSLYKPLQTNITMLPESMNDLVRSDESYIAFMNKYGRLRKALMISTEATPVAKWVNDTVAFPQLTKYKVATLRDLITETGNDKFLTVHEAYYNSDVLDELLEYELTKDMSQEELAIANSDVSASPAPSPSTKPNKPLDSARSDLNDLRQWQSFDYSFATDSLTASYRLVAGSKGAKNIGPDGGGPLAAIIRSTSSMLEATDDANYDLGMSAMIGLNIIATMYESDRASGSNDGAKNKNKNLASFYQDDMNQPVFVSTSRKLTGITDVDSKAKVDASAWNGYLLKNIANSTAIRYTSNLDMDSPLFIDIFGNILTESGLVVIPAAANATLLNKANLLTSAFLLNYGKTAKIPVEDNNFTQMYSTSALSSLSEYHVASDIGIEGESSQILQVLSTGKDWELNPVIVEGSRGSQNISINVRYLSSEDKTVMSSVYQLNLAMMLYNFFDETNSYRSLVNSHLYIGTIIPQVTCGTTMSQLDYAKEGIRSNKLFDINGTILSQAARYEQLRNSLLSDAQNAVLSLPNLAFMEHVDVVIFFILRVLIVLAIVALMLQIYFTTVRSKITPISVLNIMTTMAMMIAVVVFLPRVMDFTYYEVNRELLQGEAVDLALLQSEKMNNSVELGLLSTTDSDLSTKLLIRLHDINVPTFEFLGDILLSTDLSSLQEIYNRYIDSDEVAKLPGLTTYGDGVYISVDDLFASSKIITDPVADNSGQIRHLIYQSVETDNYASFWLPYYAIVDYLCYNINTYNATLDSYSYSNFLYGDGSKRSIDFTSRYFGSDAFLLSPERLNSPDYTIPADADALTITMAGYDRVGVMQFYNQQVFDARRIFSAQQKESMVKSQWFVEHIPVPTLISSASNLDDKAIKWVMDNSGVLGRVSDETFIKVLALYLSLEYNKEFNIAGPQALEIYNIGTDDLMRFSIASKELVAQNSPYNYPRFLLEVGGPVAIYLGTMLELIITLSSWLKPIATIGIFTAMILSLFIYRALLRRKSANIPGFAKFVLILSAGNIMYALIVKGSMFFAGLGMPPLICLMLQIFLHSAYLFFYVWITMIVLRNWKDLGNAKFNAMINATNVSVRSQRNEKTEVQNFQINNTTDGTSAPDSPQGWDLYNKMLNDDQTRGGGGLE